MVKNPRPLVLIVLGLWLTVILGVTIRGVVAPHQNSVFLVFRNAGDHWLKGQPLYSEVGKYLYSPLAAAFFAPFALLPDWAGSVLWRLGAGASYLAAVICWLCHREKIPANPMPAGLPRDQPAEAAGSWIKSAPQRRSGSLLQDRVSGKGVELKPRLEDQAAAGLALLLLLPLSVGNLNNGQASPTIIALLIFACLASLSGRWALAAGCVAVSAFFKIYPLAIGLLLAVIEPRKLSWRLALGVLILGVLSLVLQRPAYVIEQYGEWWRSLNADQRRVSTELGSWRDTWLLLRILHIPITVAGYAILQAGTAMAAAVFCWWRSKTWDRPAVIWSAFSIGCLWITLFGPSTELATYVFLAPSVAFACSWVLWPAMQGRQPLRWFEFLPIAAYALLLFAEATNAWVPVIRHTTYLHAIQPVAALLFLGFVLLWRPVCFRPSDLGAS